MNRESALTVFYFYFLLYIFLFLVRCVFLYFLITAALCVLKKWMNEYAAVHSQKSELKNIFKFVSNKFAVYASILN